MFQAFAFYTVRTIKKDMQKKKKKKKKKLTTYKEFLGTCIRFKKTAYIQYVSPSKNSPN